MKKLLLALILALPAACAMAGPFTVECKVRVQGNQTDATSYRVSWDGRTLRYARTDDLGQLDTGEEQPLGYKRYTPVLKSGSVIHAFRRPDVAPDRQLLMSFMVWGGDENRHLERTIAMVDTAGFLITQQTDVYRGCTHVESR
jgi:hypothetical protein